MNRSQLPTHPPRRNGPSRTATERSLKPVLALVGAVLWAAVAPAQAQTTWNVPGDFATIQAAINDAGVVNGDTITIDAGTYTNGLGNCYGSQLYTMYINKELTIQGAGDGSNPASNTVFAPFGCGGQISSGAIFIDASNVTLSDIYIDARANMDSGTGQEVARGLQTAGPIDNLLVEDVTFYGTTHSCFEFNYATNSTGRRLYCDRSATGYNGGNANAYRIVASPAFNLEDSGTSGGASSYYMAIFQDTVGVNMTNVDLTGGASSWGQYLYTCYNFHDPVTTLSIDYENVTFDDVPTAIYLAPATDSIVSLTTDPGDLTFGNNVDVPFQIELSTCGGHGTYIGLQDFTCNADIQWMIEDDADGSQRWFESEADADAWSAANCVGTCTKNNTGCCGDGNVNPFFGEECDEGNQNGQPDSCCTSTCEFVAAGTICRARASECDLTDVCSGSSGTCPTDLVPDGTSCYTDPAIVDPNEPTPQPTPDGGLPCTDGDCICQSGECVAPGANVPNKASTKASKPTATNGKGKAQSLVIDSITAIETPGGVLRQQLLAGEIYLRISDASNFSSTVQLTTCSEKTDGGKITCLSADGATRATFNPQTYSRAVYDLKATMVQLDPATTGAGPMVEPIEVALTTASFYRVDRLGETTAGVCKLNSAQTTMRCKEPKQ